MIIGAGSSGTSSLYQYLRQHPNVYMPPKKELHFFVHDEPGTWPTKKDGSLDRFNPVTTWEDYLGWFAKAQPGMAVGEASPMYMYFEHAAARIKDRLPDVKLIAILRNPADRAFSGYIHTVRDGLEPLDFKAALEEEPNRRRRRESVGFYASASTTAPRATTTTSSGTSTGPSNGTRSRSSSTRTSAATRRPSCGSCSGSSGWTTASSPTPARASTSPGSRGAGVSTSS
jgi:hypothetical protein